MVTDTFCRFSDHGKRQLYEKVNKEIYKVPPHYLLSFVRQVRPLWRAQNADWTPSKRHYVYRCYQRKHLPVFRPFFPRRAKLFCNRAPAKTALFSWKRPRRAALRCSKRHALEQWRKRRKTVVLCYSFLRTVQGSVAKHLNGTGAGPPGRANARRGSKPRRKTKGGRNRCTVLCLGSLKQGFDDETDS